MNDATIVLENEADKTITVGLGFSYAGGRKSDDFIKHEGQQYKRGSSVAGHLKGFHRFVEYTLVESKMSRREELVKAQDDAYIDQCEAYANWKSANAIWGGSIREIVLHDDPSLRPQETIPKEEK